MTSSPELPPLPAGWRELHDAWDDPAHREAVVEAFGSGRISFVPGLLPERAVRLTARELLQILEGRLGTRLDAALSRDNTDPRRPAAELEPALRGPVAHHADGAWLRRTNMVGINVRTVGSFWNALKYSLTLPAAQDAIHLLPIWEPGVVKSLYGPCSWELNDEFFSAELAAELPDLDSTARQLRAVVNLLHLGGRAVGMDVIPHTDRYSQMSLAFPEHFEWLRREGQIIADHRADLHLEVQQRLFELLRELGPAEGDIPPSGVEELFGDEVNEARRLRLLFGRAEDHAGREARRIAMVKRLHGLGYEPVPATMGPPYRGIEVDPDPAAAVTDTHGLVWNDYRVTRPTEFSRCFGPLARYKLYERIDDNAEWAVDFSRPRLAVWRYICQHYARVQRSFGFDFMRGDMSHVQMRAEGVPETIGEHYDPLRAVKLHIQRENHATHFGYFAESFLAPRDVMGYGDEVDHLEASEAEVTLGNLQSMTVGTAELMAGLRRYLDLAATRRVAPCFTMMTADKDDPRFDAFYVAGGPFRLFVALFLTELPSYMGLGFEVRDVHLEPAPNEHYTKLYVFQERSGPKATRGPYRWGRNGELFHTLTRLRQAADEILPAIREEPVRWLLPPDPTAGNPVLAWRAAQWLFVAHAGLQREIRTVGLPLEPTTRAELRLATVAPVAPEDHGLRHNGAQHQLARLRPGECRIYRLA